MISLRQNAKKTKQKKKQNNFLENLIRKKIQKTS